MKTYFVLPGNVINVTNDVPNWNDVQFLIEEKEEAEDTKAGYPLTARVYGEWYSDTDQRPLPSPFPVTNPATFGEPSQAASVALSEINILQADQTVISIIRVAAEFAPYIGKQKGRVYYKKSTEADALYKDAGVIDPDPVTLQGAMEIRGLEKVAYDIKVVPENSFVSAGLAGAAVHSWTVTGKLTAPGPISNLVLSYDGARIVGIFDPSTAGDIKQYEMYKVTGAQEGIIDHGLTRRFTYRPPENWSGSLVFKVYARNWSNVLSTGVQLSISPPTAPQVADVDLTEQVLVEPDQSYNVIIKGVVTFAASVYPQRGRVFYKKSTEADSAYIDIGTIIPDAALKASFEVRGVEIATYHFKVVTEIIGVAPNTLASATVYPIPIATPLATVFDILTHAMRETDMGLGVYIPVRRAAGAGSWFGTTLFRDRGYGGERIGVLTHEATVGTAVGTLATHSFETNDIDTANTLTVDFPVGFVPVAATEAEVRAGKNNLIVGQGTASGGEKVGYRVVAQVGGFTNRWNLTTLIRGMSYTTALVGSHAASEKVAVINDALVFVPQELRDIAVLRTISALTFGQTTAPTSANFTLQGNSIKPRPFLSLLVQKDLTHFLSREMATRGPRSCLRFSRSIAARRLAC